MAKPEDKEAHARAKAEAARLPVMQTLAGARREGEIGGLQVWREPPWKRLLGTLPAETTEEGVNDYITAHDARAAKKGAQYRIVVTDGQGAFLKSSPPWRLFDPPDVFGDDDDARGRRRRDEDDDTDRMGRHTAFLTELHDASTTKLLAQIDALNRMHLDRMREESRERERDHVRAMERVAADGEARLERERAWLAAQQAREREWLSVYRDAAKPSDGLDAIGALVMGAKLRDELSGDSDDDSMIGPLARKLGSRLMRKLDRDERGGDARPNSDAEGGGDDDGGGLADFAVLARTLDADTLSRAIVGFVKRKRIDRDTLRVIAAGEADAELAPRYGAKLVDKIKRAAQDALHALDADGAAAAAPAPGPAAAPGG